MRLLTPVLGHGVWRRGRRLRHAGMVGLLALMLVTFWRFNGFALME
ncbi:hypothetical protein [Halomonas nitroreducens]|nr:hypothetical protein [Halomonas nitroreducens]